MRRDRDREIGFAELVNDFVVAAAGPEVDPAEVEVAGRRENQRARRVERQPGLFRIAGRGQIGGAGCRGGARSGLVARAAGSCRGRRGAFIRTPGRARRIDMTPAWPSWPPRRGAGRRKPHWAIAAAGMGTDSRRSSAHRSWRLSACRPRWPASSPGRAASRRAAVFSPYRQRTVSRNCRLEHGDLAPMRQFPRADADFDPPNIAAELRRNIACEAVLAKGVDQFRLDLHNIRMAAAGKRLPAELDSRGGRGQEEGDGGEHEDSRG